MIFAKHIRLFLKALFHDFPRRIGIPKQFPVNSLDQFISLAQRNHMDSPIFTNLYQLFPALNEVEIDKFWIDQDSLNQTLLMLDAKTIYKRLIEFGFAKDQILIGFTGKKGFHVYGKLDSKKYDIDLAKKAMHYILSYICRDLITPDKPLFGNVNGVARVPGIMRPEGTIMVILNPEELFLFNTANEYFESYNFEWNKIISAGNRYMKQLNPKGAKIDILELAKLIKQRTGFVPVNKYVEKIRNNKIVKSNYVKRNNIYQDILKKILKDEALFYSIHSPNPVDIDRVRFAVKLMNYGLDIQDCVDIIETLEWIDYNSTTTLNKLNYIQNKYIKN